MRDEGMRDEDQRAAKLVMRDLINLIIDFLMVIIVDLGLIICTIGLIYLFSLI